MKKYNIFWKVLFSFVAFSLCISIFFALYLFWNTDKLAEYLLLQQVQPVMYGLVEAEKRDHFSEDSSRLERSLFADSINGTFLVGHQVPPKWADRPSGLYMEKRNFVYIAHSDGIVYSLSGSASPLRRALASLGQRFLLASLLGMALAGIVSWILSRNLANPILSLTSAVSDSGNRRILIPEQLGRRGDEIGILARAIMGHQKEALAYWQRETAFTGDISHELRTHLAILQSSLELLRARHPVLDEEPQIYRMVDTIGEMTLTLQSLLVLARKILPPLENINMRALGGEEIERLNGKGRVIFETGGVTVARGHRELAACALRNILRNALQYSPCETSIKMVIEGHCLVLMNEVEIGEKEQGHGLGLALAKRCCEKMGWIFEFEISGPMAESRMAWPPLTSGMPCSGPPG